MILLLFVALALSSFVPTPFGLRRRECVLQLKEGETHVHEHPDSMLRVEGFDALTNAKTSRIVKVSPICHQENSWATKRKLRANWGPNNYTCSSLPCNDWCDNAGWMDGSTGQKYIRGFSGDYTSPNLPQTTSNQVLFYFLGLENTDGLGRHGPNRVILQPVLTFGNGQPTTSWYIESWACCPSNMTVSSSPISNIPEGAVMNTFVNKTSDTEGFVSSSYSPVVNSTLSTNLYIYLNGPPNFMNRRFDWSDLTLEMYSANSCDEIATGPMTFSNLQLWDNKYQNIDMTKIKWQTTTNKPCKGRVTVLDPYTVTIEHN